MPEDPIWLYGLTLAEIEEAAIRAAFLRWKGNRRRMRLELGLSKSSLLRKLVRFGLRGRRKRRHLTESDLADCFQRHRKAIAVELRIADSTFIRWLNSKTPFAVEE
jgi:hypothetical protein